ncbi:MAG: hypothetical protein ACRD6X_05420 [Pyrinomonadaceae bacterium]
MRKSTIALFAYTFCGQLVLLLYSVWDMPLPAVFDILYPIAFLWVVAWWFSEDCNAAGDRWPLDMGMYLYAGWMFILPYYLFKTRGAKGFVGILAFVGVNLAAWVVALILVNL